MSVTGAISRNPALKLALRPSEARGKADHGWLKSFHTFSFANYFNPKFNAFGPLRVINEDRVAPGEGFGTHPHAEFEIFSWIVSGELAHRDSMGNEEVLRAGDLQMTSAGTGIRHSEYQHGSKPVHFLQIWAIPNESRLKPSYTTRHFPRADRLNKLVPVVAPVHSSAAVSDEREAAGPAPVHADLHLFATVLEPGQEVGHRFKGALKGGKPRRAYVHVIQTSGYNTKASFADGGRIMLNDELEMGEGDGAFVEAAKEGSLLGFRNTSGKEVEVLVFDMSSD